MTQIIWFYTSADDLLHEAPTHHRLDGRRLAAADEVLVHKVLQATRG
jgi:hypothetical protein